MTEWGVFGVIASIVALFLAIGTPIIKLNANVTTLNNQIKALQSCIDDFKTSNREAHKKMWNKLDEYANHINDLQMDVELLKARKENSDG